MCQRVISKLQSLTREPRPARCKKLRGYKDQWRVRIGDWRIVYIVDDKAKLVSVTRIAHRREVYDYQSCVSRPKCKLLRHHFLLNHHFQMRGHVLMQLHRHGEFAQGLQRLVQLNLAAIQIDSLLHDGVGNVAGGDRAE
jgi:mRNA interferase RelE/StbE